MTGPARLVTIAKFEEVTGVREWAARGKIREGKWKEGRESLPLRHISPRNQ